MAILSWQTPSNIENSIKKFIDAQILSQSLQLLDQNGVAQDISVRIGKTVNNSWNLPLIQLYYDSKISVPLELGSNNQLKDYLVIIECRTLLPGQESNLAEWLEDLIKNGMTYYEYTVNAGFPDAPTETDSGHINLSFVSSNPVNTGDDADLYDKNRYRTTIKCWLT
ncbi:MAG: hypothetical protein M0R03_12430 [Novosphingobium sp.]|nr:hypothetical protein [Novosphingobium sp.]